MVACHPSWSCIMHCPSVVVCLWTVRPLSIDRRPSDCRPSTIVMLSSVVVCPPVVDRPTVDCRPSVVVRPSTVRRRVSVDYHTVRLSTVDCRRVSVRRQPLTVRPSSTVDCLTIVDRLTVDSRPSVVVCPSVVNRQRRPTVLRRRVYVRRLSTIRRRPSIVRPSSTVRRCSSIVMRLVYLCPSSSDGAHIISAVAFWMLVSGEEWCRNAREEKK